MGLENRNETTTRVKVDTESIKELSPTDILDQINRTLLYNFADGSRPIAHEEVLKLEETREIIEEILEGQKDKLVYEFQGKNGNSFTLDLLTGVVMHENKNICRLSRNEKSFLYGLISNPGKIMSKEKLNQIIYPEQRQIAEISYQDGQRLQVIKGRMVKKLGHELGSNILPISRQGYLWDNGS